MASAQNETVDNMSVMPYCTVLFDGNKDAETASCEANQRETVAAAAGLPYSPPEIRRPFKPSNSKRQQLIAKEAAEIYLLRPRSKAGKLIPRGSMAHCKVMTNFSRLICITNQNQYAPDMPRYIFIRNKYLL